MTTIIPTPAPVPDPLSSDFGTKAYDFTVWMADAAPAMTAVAQETNDALNNSLLGMVSTTTSSITIAAPGGTVNFTTQANKGYAIGMTLKIASTANPANYVKVRLTAYNISTGVSAGTIISNGGSGTFASWSVFFDVPDPSVLSVPTGEAVAAGNLLAIDDGGNSMSAGAITTAALQASAASSLHACGLANGNTFICWNIGNNSIIGQIISKSGSSVQNAASVQGGVQVGTVLSCTELSNGNIVFCYITTGGGAEFRIITPAFGAITSVLIESGAVGQIKCCALTGGGFAVTYSNSTNNRIAVYSNTGSVVLAPANNVTGAQTRVAICSTAAGGFIALAGTNSLTGNIYNSTGSLVAASAINISTATAGADANVASFSGSCVAAGSIAASQYGPVVSLASDSTNTLVNSASGGNLRVPFDDVMSFTTSLGNAHIATLANGNYVTTFSTRSNAEYPRYVIFNSIGQVLQSGVIFGELTHASAPVFVIPKDTNGFSLIWLATNGNVKFAQVKSGNIVGVSIGAVGSTHQYLPNGSVTLASTNMVNVGGAKINYKRQGEKVVI